MLKIFLKGAAIVIAGVLIFGSGIAQGETLPEAIQQVLVTHPEMKASSFQRQARDQQVIQARGPYYPKLDASMSWGFIQQDKPFYDRTWPSQSTVSLRQNIFRGGADYFDVERQQANVKSQAYLLQATSENMSLLTAKVYLNVLKNTELSALAKENLLNHERIGDQVKLRQQSGVDRGADLAQVQGRLALAQSNVVVTAANLLDARSDYQAVVNRLPGELVKPTPVNAPLPATFEEAEQLALNSYPTIKSAKADLEARKAQYKVAKAQLSPSFDIAADYNWTDDISTNPRTGLIDRRDYFSGAAVLSFNVFNGLRNQGRIKETLYLIHEAEQILYNTERQTIQSIRLSLEAYQAAQDRVKHLEEYVKATEATAAAFLAQWNIGRRTMFDLLDTQAEAINAKASLATAKYDRLYAEYRVLSGMGKLVHALGLQWPEESRVAGERAEAAPAVMTVKTEAPAAAAAPAPQVAEPAKAEAPAAPAVEQPMCGGSPCPEVEPLKVEAPAPQASEPVKPAVPDSGKTIDGFDKADKDGFIKSR